MKIAVIGTRGIPTSQGGVERHVEELYARLAQNHDITVYCRNNYTPSNISEYKSIKVRRLPNLNTKHFDAISHTFLAACDTFRHDYDIIHFHAIGPNLLSFIPRIKRRAKIVATVHALDWQRAKWRMFAKTMLKLGERASVTFPDLTISVSNAMKEYLKEKYGRDTIYIPNGINKPALRQPAQIRDYSLKKHGYVLFLGRLVPEKNPHLLIQAFKDLKTDLRLVIAGDTSHTDTYHESLMKESANDDRIIFTGIVGGDLLRELYSNAYLFVLPSSLEGTPITLLEALSYGLPTLCSDIEPNLEIVGRDGQYATVFHSEDLQDLKVKLSAMLADTNGIRVKAQKASEKIIDSYNWDKIAIQTERAYKTIIE